VFPDVAEASEQLEANDVEARESVVFGQGGTVVEMWVEGLNIRLRPTADRDAFGSWTSGTSRARART
jgi:hypothetical protein